MEVPLLVQDACVLINLLATGHFEGIAKGIGHQLAVSKAAASETIFLRNPDTGDRESIELQPIIENGLMEILNVETSEELSLYVGYATVLDDGEAMSLALAESRSLALATDDRKARRIIASEELQIELWSTVDILKAWHNHQKISPDKMRSVLTRISQRSRFFPKAGHPDRSWWDSFFRD